MSLVEMCWFCDEWYSDSSRPIKIYIVEPTHFHYWCSSHQTFRKIYLSLEFTIIYYWHKLTLYAKQHVLLSLFIILNLCCGHFLSACLYRYLVFSGIDFFRHAGAICCTSKYEIWRGKANYTVSNWRNAKIEVHLNIIKLDRNISFWQQ